MPDSKLFQTTMWLLLAFLTIWVGTQISFIFRPVVVLITTIFFPVLIAGILYYLTNPLVTLLSQRWISRTIAILIVYLITFSLLASFLLYLWPALQQQLFSLVDNAPRLFAQLHRQLMNFQESALFSQLQDVNFFDRWSNIDYGQEAEQLVNSILSNLTFWVGYFTNLVIVSFTIPFILFYMLKDGHRLPDAIAKFFPSEYQEEVKKSAQQMSATLSAYIKGQLIVSLFVGFMVYMGYLIIGLEYALLLAFIALITNVIPYFGPIIGTIPGIVVGLIHSPWMAVQVLILVFIVQQIESQVLSPQIFGRQLAIHPLTIIFVLLTAGSLAGILGMILAIPTYAVAKVVVTNIYHLAKLRVNLKQ